MAGRVASVDGGDAIAAAEITFVGPDGAHAARTDDGGRFVFQPSREGLYEITLITCAGFVPFAPELGSSPMSWVARRGIGISGLTLRLERSVEYVGIVVDPRGDRVPQADIRIFDAESAEFALTGFPTRLVSDDRGEFRFHAPNDAIVEARHLGFSAGRANVGFGTQIGKRLTVKLGPPRAADATTTIRGVVVDGAGIALPDVVVSASVESNNPASDAARLDPGASTRTDERGTFLLEGLGESLYTVRASDGDHAPASTRSVRAGGPRLELVLSEGASLTGRVIDELSGAPIPAISIVVSERQGPLVTHAVRTATVFDADGRFAIRHLVRGTYVVTAVAEGYAAAPEREVAVDSDASVDFTLSRGGKLVGFVRSRKTNAPLERARVSLEDRYGSNGAAASISSVATTDRDGRFELTGIASGTRSVLAAAEGHHGRVIGGLAFGESVGPIEIALSPVAEGEEPRIELVGIGAILAAKDDVLIVGKVAPGGGAAEAGLAIGDALLSIDGIPIVNLGFGGAIARIRGAEGTTVSLLVRRAAGGEPLLIGVVRRPIKS